MNTVVAALVAILAKRNTDVLQALLNMVGITRPSLITNATGHGFNGCQVSSLSGGQFIVQINPKLPVLRQECIYRQPLCAQQKPRKHRYF